MNDFLGLHIIIPYSNLVPSKILFPYKKQGELIDRIEYHVSFTVEKVAEGKKELDVAEGYHKEAIKVSCLLSTKK